MRDHLVRLLRQFNDISPESPVVLHGDKGRLYGGTTYRYTTDEAAFSKSAKRGRPPSQWEATLPEDLNAASLQQRLDAKEAENIRLKEESDKKLSNDDNRAFKETVIELLDELTRTCDDHDYAYGLVPTDDMTSAEKEAIRIARRTLRIDAAFIDEVWKRVPKVLERVRRFAVSEYVHHNKQPRLSIKEVIRKDRNLFFSTCATLKHGDKFFSDLAYFFSMVKMSVNSSSISTI
jgi:hypothetical protein